ncbi:tetratricopeptide repeat protein [Blastopirellula sp. JC732]|uniref:Tetratricopeptide repeat protein n=1 Tax=Blastopirellula sediminis TaxID=2894196 RepID=A0A9X1MJF2_9BACT|nr:tetratricopeptide repeat protein [Blastopirellula sediminis]MCC9607755.1 tetratricopeptide repeat protein [Blastopirellula sediminis]MCC9627452.1 tetratricopeptide repeat protein [Blastopirellula sediminis]
MMRNIRLLLALVLIATSFVMTKPACADGPADLYAVAASQYARKDWEAAIVAFDRFIDDYPNHSLAGPIYFYRGEALIQLEDFDAARKSYEQFLQRVQTHASRPQAEFRIAECYYLTGDLEHAKADFDTFVASRKEDRLYAHALPYLGEIALANEKYDNAEQLFREAKTIAPNAAMQGEAELGLARTLRESGQLTAARQAYRNALKQEITEKQDAKFELGVVEYRLGNHRVAVDLLNEVANAGERNSAVAKLWIAKAYYEVRDWPQAEQRLQDLAKDESLKQYRDEIDYLTARIRLEQGGTSEGLTLLEQLLVDYPASPWCDESLYYLAEAAIVTGDVDKASVAAERLILEYPNREATPKAVRLVAGKRLEKEQYAAALQLLDSLGSDDVSPEMKKTAAAWRFELPYLRGIAQLGAGNASQAAQLLTAAIKATDDPQQQGSAYYALGLAADRSGEDADAARNFAKYLEVCPSGDEAPASRLLLAAALARIGQLDDAKATYALVDRTKCDPRLYLLTTRRLAETAMKAGDKQWAGELFEKLAEEGNPEEFIKSGVAGLSWVQLDAVDNETSTAAIQQLIEKDPTSTFIPSVLSGRAKVLLDRNQAAEALAIYQQIYRDYPESDQAPGAMLTAAQILNDRKEFGRAAELFRALIQAPSQEMQLDDLHYRLGWALVDQGKPEAAADQWRMICENYPQSELWSDAAYRRAESLLTDGQADEATKVLQQIVAKGDANVAPHATYLLGQIAVGAADWETAAAQMAKLETPSSDEQLRMMASFWHAEALFHQQKFSDASKLFNDVDSLARGRELPWSSTVALRRAQLAAHLGSWEESLRLAELAVVSFPDFEQRYELDYLRGRCLARQARFAEARDAYQLVIDSRLGGATETAAMAQWMVGETYFHQKNYQAAIQAYSRVAALYNFPRWKAGSLLQIGKCYEISRQWDKAQKYYDEVAANYPESFFAGEAQQRLNVVKQRRETADVNTTERR